LIIAARAGCYEAQALLVLMYQTGTFVEKNDTKAYFWLVKMTEN
jgi:TPR repeat protein